MRLEHTHTHTHTHTHSHTHSHSLALQMPTIKVLNAASARTRERKPSAKLRDVLSDTRDTDTQDTDTRDAGGASALSYVFPHGFDTRGSPAGKRSSRSGVCASLPGSSARKTVIV